MKILFMHQTMPAQYKHLVWHLANRTDHEVTFICRIGPDKVDKVRMVKYEVEGEKPPPSHHFLINYQDGIRYGYAAARAALNLQREGYRPDVIIAHPGWGDTFYIKDVFPKTPLLSYFEFFYHPTGADTFFDLRETPKAYDRQRIFTKNAVNLMSLEHADWGITPTTWQWRLFPAQLRHRISVIHEGVDTDVVAPDSKVAFKLPNGRVLTRADEVLTHVERNLEPYRGFPSFMRAAALIAKQRPNCQILIAGGEAQGYGKPPPKGTTYRQMMEDEVKINPEQLHFLGRISYADYVKLLQVSTAHVYLTMPFVLSWSLLEAMAAGCLVVGSNTPPVVEVIEDGVNGMLADFFSPEEIADRIELAFAKREAMRPIREQARRTILDKYNLRRCLPLQLQLIYALAQGNMPTPVSDQFGPERVIARA
jgi:glycosyltransferase involved in cell wall biosynthesis